MDQESIFGFTVLPDAYLWVRLLCLGIQTALGLTVSVGSAVEKWRLGERDSLAVEREHLLLL